MNGNDGFFTVGSVISPSMGEPWASTPPPEVQAKSPKVQQRSTVATNLQALWQKCITNFGGYNFFEQSWRHFLHPWESKFWLVFLLGFCFFLGGARGPKESIYKYLDKGLAWSWERHSKAHYGQVQINTCLTQELEIQLNSVSGYCTCSCVKCPLQWRTQH